MVKYDLEKCVVGNGIDSSFLVCPNCESKRDPYSMERPSYLGRPSIKFGGLNSICEIQCDKCGYEYFIFAKIIRINGYESDSEDHVISVELEHSHRSFMIK